MPLLETCRGTGNLVGVSLDAVIQAVIGLIAFAALIVSIAAFRRSAPRLTIWSSTPIVLYDEGSRAMTLVEITNDGGADVIISQVFLRAVDGSAAFYFKQSGKDVGPKLPHRLDANGGRSTWAFDYSELRRSYDRTVRDNQLVLKACIRVGARVQRGRQSIYIARPGSVGEGSSRVDRMRVVIREFVRPRTQLMGMIDVSAIDLGAGKVPLMARNFGRWWSRPFTATLIASKEGEEVQERVPKIEQARFPRIRPRGAHQLMVPLVNDPSPGISLWWSVTSGPGIGNGVAATTWTQARSYREHWETAQKPGGSVDGARRSEADSPSTPA